MSGPGRLHALMLAATEVLPGEWQDLTPLLERGDIDRLLTPTPLQRDEPSLIPYLRAHLDKARVDVWEQRLRELQHRLPNVGLVTVADSAYPANLRLVHDRPPLLFTDGAVTTADRYAVAIVGSRSASEAGRSAAHDLAQHFASAGVTVVSGLAEGIDTAAHTGALAAKGGRTIAVLGTGIDIVFPHSNRTLARQIRERGCVLSQFRPGSPPTSTTFPMRNAVISGLSLASLVIEGGRHSGTSSEAEHALRQGRPLLAWASRMADEPWLAELVAQGRATLVEDAQQVLAVLQRQRELHGAGQPPSAALG